MVILRGVYIYICDCIVINLVDEIKRIWEISIFSSVSSLIYFIWAIYMFILNFNTPPKIDIYFLFNFYIHTNPFTLLSFKVSIVSVIIILRHFGI